MSLRFNRQLLLAKNEVTPSTAVALAAADAVLASSIEIQPLVTDQVERELITDYFANHGSIPVNARQTISFKVELASSGSPGTAPAWAALLLACGMAETVTANTRAVYTPVSDGEKTATIQLYLDGQRHTLAGARGTFSLAVNANQIPYINFEFTGIWAAPATAAAPANPDTSNYQFPIIPASVTSEFRFFGNSDLSLAALSYDHAVEITYRDLVGGTPGVAVTGRKPTGNITLDTPTVAELALVSKARQGESGVLNLTLGTIAGQIIQIAAPKVQITGQSYSNDNNILQSGIPLAFRPVGGNDEIKITAQ